jgi:hypothetical protein
VQSPIEVQFVGLNPMNHDELLFQSKHPKRSLGEGSVGSIVFLGRTTTHYDGSGNVVDESGEVYVRFEVVSHDPDAKVAVIRPLD